MSKSHKKVVFWTNIVRANPDRICIKIRLKPYTFREYNSKTSTSDT